MPRSKTPRRKEDRKTDVQTTTPIPYWRQPKPSHDAATTSSDPPFVTLLSQLALLTFTAAVLAQTAGAPTFSSLQLTVPAFQLGLLELSLVVLVGIWFYSQYAHEQREHGYYFSKAQMFTPTDLVTHG